MLTQRLDLAPQSLGRVEPDAAKIGVTVHAVEVKDVMLPADLKRAFSDVLKARPRSNVPVAKALRCATSPTPHACWKATRR